MNGDGDLVLHLARRLLARRLHLRLDLLAGALEETVGVASGVLAPFLLKRIVDRLAAHQAGGLGLTILAFVAAWSAGSLFGGLKGIHSTRIVERVAADLAADALRHQLPRIAGGAIESQPVFSALERLPLSLQILVDGLLWRLLPLLIQVLASLIAIAWLTPGFAALLAVSLAVYAWLADRGARACRRQADAAQAASVRVARSIGDVLANARRVVFNGALAYELDRFVAIAGQRRSAAIAFAGGFAGTTSLQFLALLIGVGLVLVVAGLDVASGRLSIGVFVLLQAYAFRLSGPLAGVGYLAKEAVTALANLRVVLGFVQAATPPPALEAVPTASAPGVLVCDIAYKHPGSATGLDAVHAVLPRGAFIALVGPNGAGKSTLARILGGVQPPDAGAVLVDGASLYAMPPERRIALALYVPQTVSLFDRTLRENGLYPPSRLTADALLHRLGQLHFYDHGRSVDLDALVGEGGQRLSGGQVQKLELARMTGVEVPLLILDELTAALDQASAHAAVAALRQASPRTTLLLVTHDPRLAEAADQVLFLSQGRLAGIGSHRSLSRGKAAYRALWETMHGPA